MTLRKVMAAIAAKGGGGGKKNWLPPSYFEGSPNFYGVNGNVITVKQSDYRGWTSIGAITIPAGKYKVKRSNGTGGLNLYQVSGAKLLVPQDTVEGEFTISQAEEIKVKLGIAATGLYPFDVTITLYRTGDA